MIPLFIVFAQKEALGVAIEYPKAGFYTSEEAIRFIQQARDVYKQDTQDWYWEEFVLANNADKLSEAMFTGDK